MNKFKNLAIAIVAIIIGIFLFTNTIERVAPDEIVIKENPFTGSLKYWTTPGPKRQWFGSLTKYHKTQHVKFDEIQETAEGVYSTTDVDYPALPIQYAEKGKGFILGSVKIELPTNPEQLQIIREQYNNEERLFNELVRPTIGKVILATGPLMTSLESVAEKRNDLNTYITDQLNNGIYATQVKVVEQVNSITNEVEKVHQAFIVYDENGKPKRSEESPFVRFGLKVSNLAISNLYYEKATIDQIAKQRTAEMDIITAKTEAAKAIQETIKIEERGKQAAAQAKWEQEAIKAKAVTEAEQQREVSRLAAEKAEFDKKAVIAKGSAEAEAARLKVAAGLSPLEKATIEKERAIGVAEALAKTKWPTIVMAGGSNGNSAMDVIALERMNALVDQMSK